MSFVARQNTTNKIRRDRAADGCIPESVCELTESGSTGKIVREDDMEAPMNVISEQDPTELGLWDCLFGSRN